MTRDADLFERAVRYHDHGGVRSQFEIADPHHEGMIGLQFRMNELTAAAAMAQFGRLEWILERTRAIHERLRTRLEASCPGIRFRPVDDPRGDAGIALYMVMKDADIATRFTTAVEAEGIRVGPSSACRNLTTHPLLKNRRMAHPAMPPFGQGCAGESVSYEEDDFPQTRDVLERLVALAVTPGLTDRDVDDMHDAVAKVWVGLGLGDAGSEPRK